MAKTIDALVVKPLIRQGRSYVQGDRITVSPTEALALGRQGFVTLTRGAKVASPPPPKPEPPARRRSRRTYRTTELVADTAPE